MLRKLGLTLLCAAATLSTPTYAMTTLPLQAGMTIEYIYPANEPQILVNYMFWTVEGNCKIITEDNSNVLFAEVLAKKGKINGVELRAGETMSVPVRHGDTLKLSADSGAKVKITNFGPHDVKAICSA